MQTLDNIVSSVRSGERLTAENALILWREAPLWLLGELATERKRQMSGDEVYYNRNIHLEPTNICLFNCEFCSFRRREGDADAWNMSLDDIEARAREMQSSDITEVHIVGGVHPKHDLNTYCAMIRRVKGVLPEVAVKAYTAVEILYMTRRAGISIVEGLRRLKEAGMDAIPGGGAEIFDETLREKLCPEKCSSEEWLAVHRAAHNMGIPTNCTMLYGHVESLEQRIDHLERLRKLQDTAPGFDAFIPLKYRSRHNRMSSIGECSVEDDLRMIAMSRLYLDNIPHIKAYWVAYGKPTTEMALAFGADDIDGTIDDSTKIYSMAGADQKPAMSADELCAMVQSAGFTPVERDTHYNHVLRTKPAATKQPAAPKQPIAPSKTEPVRVAERESVAAPIAEEKPSESKQNSNTVVVAEPVAKSETAPKNESKERMHQREDKENSGVRRATKSAVVERGSAAAKRGVKSAKGFLASHPVWRNVVYIGLLMILLIILLYIGLMVGTRHGKSIDIPNFVGEHVSDVERMAEDLDLNIVIRDSVFDSDVAGGVVVDQLPRTSSIRTVTVKPGRKIYVTINAYNRRIVDVPFVAKQPLRQALNQLERAGLTIDKLVYQPDMTSTDYVVKQSIGNRDITASISAQEPFGTGVTLHVTYRRDEQLTSVPRLVGMRLSQAKSTAWDRGLNVEKVVYDESITDFKSRREAKVYKQSLHQNSGARRGAGITLYLTCDEKLIDSLAKIADKAAKSYDAQRRKEEAALRAQFEAEEAAKAEQEAAKTEADAPATDASQEGTTE